MEGAVHVLRAAVTCAIQAPSSHNTQPWKFRIAQQRLDVFSDPTRHLPTFVRLDAAFPATAAQN